MNSLLYLRLQACLFKRRFSSVEYQFQFMQFFSCATAYIEGKNPTDQAQECINQVYEDGPNLWIALIDCAHNDDKLKDELRIKTQSVGLTTIPEIVVDGEKKTSQAGNQLLIYLCQSYDPIKPRVCADIDGSSQRLSVSVFLTADQPSQAFIQSEIKPLLAAEPKDPNLRFRDVIDWQFIPYGPSKYDEASGEIECVNGANECLANRILACANKQQQNGNLGIREDGQRVALFVVCFFDSSNWQTDPLDAANQCNSRLSSLDSFPQLWQCAVQANKMPLMFEMKDLTENNYPAMTKCKCFKFKQINCT